MSDIRWIRWSRTESTGAYNMSTRTVYYTVLQYFNGRYWVDVETVDREDEDLMHPMEKDNE